MPSIYRINAEKSDTVVPDVEMQTVAYIGSPRLAHPEQIADFKKEVVVESHDAGL